MLDKSDIIFLCNYWKSVVWKQQQFRKISTTLGVYRNWWKCKALFLMLYAIDFIADNT